MKFNWNADDYAGNSSVQQMWAEELIAKLALQGNESVVDIGCGDGKITAKLAHAVKDGYVLGIDSSDNMIRHAKEQFPATAIPNLSFRCLDATKMRFAEKFDVAFSNATLHWVKNQNAVLRGLHACLQTGGRILFQMGGRGNGVEIFAVVALMIRNLPWQPYFKGFQPPYHFYGPEEYIVWLANNGFHPVRVELIPKDMQHQGREGLKGWVRTTWLPYTDRLPCELRDAFLEELVETYLAAHPIDHLGNTHVGMMRLEVEAYAL